MDNRTINYYDAPDTLIQFITAETSFEKPSWRIQFNCLEIASSNQKDTERTATFVFLLSGPKNEISQMKKRTLIKCDLISRWTKGITDKPQEAKTYYYYIDPNNKRLLHRDSSSVMGKTTEFSEQRIKHQYHDDEKNSDFTIGIDRITGQIEMSYSRLVKDEDRRYVGGSETIENHSEGTCSPIQETPKF
jgi:hypothetical protein